ncbi:hypothetical protein LCGC14_1376610 [marine sediment metagenome]|uniref:Portal protein n=1 Tax=marine sediment metagenome TaxID=412755 RepID=A0A0F9K3Z6_9ZZZZ
MAFNPSTEDLWLEIQAALEETNQHVEPAEDILRRLTGRWYRTDMRQTDPDPENFGYAFMSNILPQLGMANPEVRVKPARVIGHRTIGQAMRDGLNSWLGDVRFGQKHETVYVDFLRIRGITLHYLDEETRFSRGAVTPQVKRLAPRQVYIDSLEGDLDLVAFIGHWYWVDEDDLLADMRIDPEVKAALIPQDDSDETKGAFKKKSHTEVNRKRVKIYSTWIRTTNMIRWIADCDKTRDVFPPTKFYGPPSGPYQFYDAYPVPDQTWPLSPLIAVEDQNRDLNIHALAMGRSAARRKTIGLVEANNPDLGQKLVEARDGEILAVKGITGNHVIIDLGGVRPEQYQYSEFIRNRLDRVSGLTATVQGMVGQAETATEAQIASQALAGRVGFLKMAVKRATGESLDRIGWYLYNTEGIIIPVNRRDPYTGEQIEGVFFGGPIGAEGASWDDFDVEIELNTMQREMQSRKDMLEFYQIFMGIVPIMVAYPWVRWMNVLRDVAISYGMEDKPDEWVIPELFGAFSQPPQYPVSQLMGGMQVPPRGQGTQGRQPSVWTPGGQQTSQPPGAQTPQNRVGSTGRVGGPRPQQAQPMGMGVN